jgi:23S rRNA (adenine2503-C2)-methyltransferase
MKVNFKEISKEEIIKILDELGESSYRAEQILRWIYNKSACSFDDMTNLSRKLIDTLKDISFISCLDLTEQNISLDGSQKFLFELKDNETIESVLIPNSTGVNRYTLCISSQVGCSLACKFCVTGQLGLKRHLLAYEIVDQVLSVKRLLALEPAISKSSSLKRGRLKEDPLITNIVFMGMGEPLNNLDEVIMAIWKMTELMGFSKRKITVSTSGIVPGIYKLAEHDTGVSLAISLNATTDETRNRIMPINKKYPLKKLMQVCRDYPLPPRRLITFEYVLLDGINDSIQDAHRLVALLRGIRSKVNLIPFNPSSTSSADLKKPDDDRILSFQGVLKKSGVTATIRKSMGSDISAACGQLKASYQ